MSALVKIIKNPFDTNIEKNVVKVKAKTCLKDIEGIDPNNFIAYVNGEHVNNDYILKNGDVCVIRQYPSAVTTSAIVTAVAIGVVAVGVGEAISYGVSGKSLGQNIKEGLQNWLLPKTNGATNQNREQVETLPSVSGSKNQSAFGKVVPLILGKTLFTPYTECKTAYNTISGTDGEEQLYNCLYLIGQKDLQIEDISMGLDVLATNTGHIENGALTITSTKFPVAKYKTRLELQCGKNEVSIFPQKVVQENMSMQILHEDGDGRPFYASSSRYAQKVELEFTFGGLVGYNSDGTKKNATAEITVEYSFDKGRTWHYAGSNASNCTFNFTHATGTNTYDSTTHKISFTNQKAKTMRYVMTHTPDYSDMETCSAQTIMYRIYRTNAESEDANVIDKIYLTAVRTWCYDRKASETAGEYVAQAPMIEKVRNKTTRLGFSIVVDEMVQRDFDKINVIATSKARTFNGTGWSKNLYPTRNPIALVLHCMIGDFRENYAYPITEGESYIDCDIIDLVDLGEKYQICETTRNFGTQADPHVDKLYYCDGVVLNPTKTVDLVNSILKCCRSYLVINGKKYGVFMDKHQDYPLLVLNNNNLLSLTYSKSFDEIPDGHRVKYVSAENFYQQDTIDIYPIGTTLTGNEKLVNVEYPFISDPYHAMAMSLYEQACLKLRPETLQAKVTGEGGLAEIGSLVPVQSDVVLVGIGDGAEIIDLITSGNTITGIITDGKFAVTDITKEYGVVINVVGNVDNYGVEKLLKRKLASFSAVGEYSTLMFDQPIGMNSTYKPEEGCIVSFGLYGTEIIDELCVGKNENGDGSYDLTLVPYDENIYLADQGAIPDFDPKTTPPQESGLPISFGDRTVPVSKFDVIEMIGDSKDMSTPPVPASISAVAKRDYIAVSWQATDDIIGYTEIQLSRNGGTSWTTVERAKANNYQYNFSRTGTGADGYPEAGAFTNYKFRLRNVSINGVESAWVTQSVDASSYGTWIPATPSFASKIPSEGGITFNWNEATGQSGRTLYGTQKYTVTVKYEDTEHSISEITLGTFVTNTVSAVYNFDRDSSKDGYPESNATANYKGLNKYKFTLTVENESGGTPVSSTEVVFSNGEIAKYKTWIPSTPVIKKCLAEENGISFEWDDVSDCYGSNHYTISIPDAEGAIPLSLGSTRFYYTFLRSAVEEGETVIKDGYPEKLDLSDWDFTVTAINSQTNRQSTGGTGNVDVSEYLGWQPSIPAVEKRSSGRTCTLSPVNTDRRYGKIMYKIMVCNPAIDYEEEGGERTYKWYLPTPTSNPFGDETNYKGNAEATPPVLPQENVPILTDSPYSQTMPLKDQTAKTYKRYSYKNDDTPLDYDDGTMKLLVYTESAPPSGATQNDVYIDNVLIEDAYCWTDSVNGLNYISFEVDMPSPKDTIYWWKIASYNAVTESLQSKTSAYVEAQATAFATSAYDVVKNGITENALAPDAVTTDKIAVGTITANKIFVEALSAISANLGAITDGSLVGNSYNYWYLSDEYVGGQLVHRAGDFRVGTPIGTSIDGDYISCTTSDGEHYHVEIHASQFNITAIGTVVKGVFFVSPNNATINPNTGIPSSYYIAIGGNYAITCLTSVTIGNSQTDRELNVHGFINLIDGGTISGRITKSGNFSGNEFESRSAYSNEADMFIVKDAFSTSPNYTTTAKITNRGYIAGSNVPLFSTVYSSNTYNSGYFLLAQLEGSASAGNHSVAMAGRVLKDSAGTIQISDFYIFARGNNATVGTALFIHTGVKSKVPLVATYEVFSTNRYRIRLYGQITGNWQRFNTVIHYASAGDVSDRISNMNVTFSNTQSSAVTGASIGETTTLDGNATTATTATNSSQLNGYSSDTANTANTVVRRDANGYIRATYYNASCGLENINSYASNSPNIIFSSSDNWLRKTNAKNISVGRAGYSYDVKETGTIAYWKIKINNTSNWMMSFVVTLYQNYKATKVMVSGYNYHSTTQWHAPKAVLLGDTEGNTGVTVYFGYDSSANLWVGFKGDQFGSVAVTDIVNGYDQITSWADLFTISKVSSLGGTTQATVTATLPIASKVFSDDFSTSTNITFSNTILYGGSNQIAVWSGDKIYKARNYELSVGKLANIGVTTTTPTSADSGNCWAYITASKITTTGGYIVYSNGFRILWGIHTNTGGNVTQYVTFSSAVGTSFTQPPIVTADYRMPDGASVFYYAINIYEVSKTGFRMNSNSSFNNNLKFFWMAMGY